MTYALCPMANWGSVITDVMPGSCSSNLFPYFPIISPSVVHCCPCHRTNCLGSSQIGQCSAVPGSAFRIVKRISIRSSFPHRPTPRPTVVLRSESLNVQHDSGRGNSPPPGGACRDRLLNFFLSPLAIKTGAAINAKPTLG
jgi:hypothetical protein